MAREPSVMGQTVSRNRSKCDETSIRPGQYFGVPVAASLVIDLLSEHRHVSPNSNGG